MPSAEYVYYQHFTRRHSILLNLSFASRAGRIAGSRSHRRELAIRHDNSMMLWTVLLP